jgi:FdrA protein
MRQIDGIEWASAAMATPANVATLVSEGFEGLDSLGANDLVLAARAASQKEVDAALEAGRQAAFAQHSDDENESDLAPVRTLAAAVDRLGDPTVAVISVPGDYAGLEATKALSAGLDVLLFSDNVSVDVEVELKERAGRLGRLLMGPGAGTAMLGGAGLGFANVVRPGRVGIVAAAGTGAQEAMSLLDRWGVGVSAVIGLGGRDLSDAVDGRMAKSAIAALRADPETDAILVVSKPPSARVAQDVLAAAQDTPIVAAMIGFAPDFLLPASASVVSTLEAGVLAMLAELGHEPVDVVGSLKGQVEEAIGRLSVGRKLVRGLYSGGTLCYEALVILGDVIGPIWSNTPLDEAHRVPAPPGSHTCLDLGEEEYTKGRPHPMIDPEARIEMLREAGAEPDVAAILLDVVIGYGAHDDPAGRLAPACADIAAAGGPQVVAYVLGTEQDPQGFHRQQEILRDAGCIVTETAARAALTGAALASRSLEPVEVIL